MKEKEGQVNIENVEYTVLSEKTEDLDLITAIQSNRQLKRPHWDNFVDYFAACFVQDSEGKISMKIARVVDTKKNMAEASEGFMEEEDFQAKDYIINQVNRSNVKFEKL